MTDPNLSANGMFEDAPCRSLVEYAEELRAHILCLEIDIVEFTNPRHIVIAKEEHAEMQRRLLAVERQINWKACI
jgi:hypothetical protein